MKIKDLTIDDIHKMCKKHGSCYKCPFDNTGIPCTMDFEIISNEILEREIDYARGKDN